MGTPELDPTWAGTSAVEEIGAEVESLVDGAGAGLRRTSRTSATSSQPSKLGVVTRSSFVNCSIRRGREGRAAVG